MLYIEYLTDQRNKSSLGTRLLTNGLLILIFVPSKLKFTFLNNVRVYKDRCLCDNQNHSQIFCKYDTLNRRRTFIP